MHIRDQGGDWSQFEREFLDAHNAYRKQHNVPALQLSRDLCRSAQAWADKLLSIRTLEHSGADHGENLFYKYSSSTREIPGHEAVDSWYSEIKNYDFNKPGFRGDTGHFTQVVWKDSKECGVGMATDGRGLFFVVGQYSPAGNITNPGYFEKNVLPPATSTNIFNSNKRNLTNQDNEPPRQRSDRDKSSSEFNQFEREFLEAHNTYRKQHGAPPLQLSRKLCRSAQEWADKLKTIRALQHSGTEDGENLFYKYSSSAREMPGREPVDSWYSEIKNYDFGRPGFKSNTGHFTQVVWKDSKEVGVGIATDGRGLYFVVGQYSPAGNITNSGYFEKNVLPPGTSPTADIGNSGKWNSPGPAQDADQSRPRTDRGKSSASVASRTSDKREFELEALDSHNLYRQQHGAPCLRLNTELCEASQRWADHLLSINALQHSNTTNGENIWYKWNSSVRDATGKEIVDTWYGEIKDYNFSKPGFQSNTGHFTQVVWKDTKEMGIAKAVDGKGMVIAVAQYNPAGNITNPGYFQRNVLPKGSVVNEQEGGRTSYPVCPREITPPATGYDDFVSDFLNATNAYRLRHGAKPLKLSPSISQDAQKWAEHLLALKTLKHSDTAYGENVWAKTGGPSTTLNGQEVADAWYKEEKNYDFSEGGHQPDTGHFTQMVWRSSKEVGVGMASSGKGMFIVVAQYNPTGNITNPGYYQRNVMPAGTKISDDDEEDVPGKLTMMNASSAVPEKDSSAFVKELLNEHNKYRSLHRAGPLQVNTGLCLEAQAWANHLMSIRALQNSDTKYGENLWYRWGTDISMPTGKEVADSWYNEIVKYNFSTPGFQNGAGNFTQMVWKSSTQAGFGVGTDGRGMYIVVGFYDPPGNISNQGYFEDNVLPKRK
ncbi:hypothetical protein NDU88_011780 [Pleurodeles waltl]|uniref:SCP domain-containing protein n=2 Tax=Pleurodeles waltl TaxID=8319 RepID=A0AAV7R034_PLEWA|nr:hypothetical protein NDU88_011780 [Pleurodeles waltl]